ncbi:hypothetical protein E2C01_009559 [Portunus trituberculatus]|uniref:Uncharacterized protein n=1 Tax=Portunus trituberculatus TaxID=210409 RepID=A0A5B7D644_PORTR|nr:hypothetical protein [Portunus trituberculatus]
MNVELVSSSGALALVGSAQLDTPSKTGLGLWLEARLRLEPRLRSLPPTLVVAMNFFTGRGCKHHPYQLGQPWAGTLVSLRVKSVAALKKRQKGREKQQKQKKTELWDVKGIHSSLG